MARTYEYFTSNDTFVVPSGVTEVIFVCVGGGGAGTLGTTLHGGIPGPGGGGGAASKTIRACTTGDSFSIVVGAGGLHSGGTADGGDTYVQYSASDICRAKGGKLSTTGNTGGLGGTTTGGVGDYKVAGGNGSDGDATYGGGGGSAGSCSAIDGDETYTEAGNVGGSPTGGAGTTTQTGLNGAGGAGGQSGHVDGYTGSNYGGGGGGTSPLGTANALDRPGDGAYGLVEVSYLAATGGPGGGLYANSTFLTFRNVVVPKQVVINNAFIRFTAKTSSDNVNDNVNVMISGQAADTGTVPADADEAYALPKTTSCQAWDNISHWVADSTYDSSDISCVIQEIVDRSGWVSGNNITIFVEDYDSGNAGSTGSNQTRLSYDYTDDPSKVAQLFVYYSLEEIASGGAVVGGTAIESVYTPTTYNNTGSGGIVAGSVVVAQVYYSYSSLGGSVVGGAVYGVGGGGPSVSVCSAIGTGTPVGKLIQGNISADADDGYWTYSYFLSTGSVKFGSYPPVV